MKKLIKLVIDDRVFARMVAIVLKNSSYELISADEDEPDAVILTDRADLKIQDGAKALYLLRHHADFGAKQLLRPFSPDDLLRAVAELSGDDDNVKRSASVKTKSEPRLDRKSKRVILGRESVTLTEKEFLLFSLLYDAKGGIVTDEEIDEKVWLGEVSDGSNITAVYVNYLRKKIEEPLGRRYILRVRGKGYRLSSVGAQ